MRNNIWISVILVLIIGLGGLLFHRNRSEGVLLKRNNQNVDAGAIEAVFKSLEIDTAGAWRSEYDNSKIELESVIGQYREAYPMVRFKDGSGSKYYVRFTGGAAEIYGSNPDVLLRTVDF